MWGAVPDPRLIPTDLIGRAFRQAARARDGLAYAKHRQGHVRLRSALAKMLSATRGLSVGPDDIMITQGTQMAIHLATAALIGPGDVVIVEAPGYRAAWNTFSAAGARLVPVNVDSRGLDTDQLDSLLREERGNVRALYTTPHHQYPTTVALDSGRRMRLLELAREHGIAVLEDDFDYEFHYDGQPLQPLASADPHGTVIYMGSLSKLLAPGLRVGFVVAPRNVLDRLLEIRAATDNHGNQLTEIAVGILFDDGDVLRHARQMRREYQQRRDVFCAALAQHLDGIVSFDVPSGGLALWTKISHLIDPERWRGRAASEGVLFQSAAASSFDGAPGPFARFGFARCTEEELLLAVDRLATAAATSRRPQPPEPRPAVAERTGGLRPSASPPPPAGGGSASVCHGPAPATAAAGCGEEWPGSARRR